jgi:hypothetical protein
MIVEFAHRRIHELTEELKDMERIIEAYTSYDDTGVPNVVRVNGMEWKNGKMECPNVIPTFNM